MHTELTLFVQLSLVLALAAGISAVMKLFRQPLIMGYIITGIIAGPSLFDIIHNKAAFESFSEIGIALLLFIVGLGLNVSAIRSLGKAVTAVVAVNTAVIGGVSYGLSLMLGFNQTESLVIAIGMLFSSTIVVIKALSDKKAITRLYGRITVGVALLEDVVATIALVVVAAMGGGDGASLQDLEILVMRGLALGAGLGVLGAFVLPRLSKFFASSQELLFMFALMWAFGVASLFEVAGFSIEVGALFAGVTLASLPYALEVSNRLKPLRDFFLVLFFVVLGERLSLNSITEVFFAAVIFSLVVVVFKTSIISATLGRLGYTEHTSYKVGIHLSQISEFSVILVVLAQTSGLVGENVVNLLTLTALITIGISTYFMHYDDKIYRSIENVFRFIERPNPKMESKSGNSYAKLILFGYRKGGHEFINAFREMKKRYVVVDYNPEVIDILERQHIAHVFGDATDFELLEEIGVHQADMVVSTITELETNLMLARHVNQWNPDGVFICHANSYDHAAQLYEHGAAYVMLPHFIGSEQMSSFIRKNGSDKQAFDRYRKRHIITLGKVAVE